MADVHPKHVTIVGGGFAGAIFAHHLLRASAVPVHIDIVDERERLGAGVAYSASDPHQTTNIPASRMSVYPDDRAHFETWLAARDLSGGDEPDHYPNRALFGAYVDQLVRTTAPRHAESVLQHRRGRVTQIVREGDALAVARSDGLRSKTDVVALATGNPVPVPPPPLSRLAADRRVILDPWAPGALELVGAGDRILIVGVGLSMGEAVAGLEAGGHRGSIVAIARRGRRPERGMIAAPPTFGEFALHRPRTAVALLRHFRTEVRRAAAVGLAWRSVALAVRAYGWEIWSSLPITERRRFVRHLRPFWEALRHVMPGPVHDRLVALERSGRLRVMASSLRDLQAGPIELRATLHRRGDAHDAVLHEHFDVVLNCTGPAYASLTESDPFWVGLVQQGLVRPDGIGLGIAVDPGGRALTPNAWPQPDLLVLGTLARGAFGELTGVPELSRQARDAAHALVASWVKDDRAARAAE